MIITPISILWSASYVREIFPNWDWKFDFLKTFEAWLIKYRLWIAWPMAIYAVILGIYTGILLSAFNARPLWNTSILGPLFLVLRDVYGCGGNHHAEQGSQRAENHGENRHPAHRHRTFLYRPISSWDSLPDRRLRSMRRTCSWVENSQPRSLHSWYFLD